MNISDCSQLKFKTWLSLRVLFASSLPLFMLILIIFLSLIFRLLPFLESNFKPYSWDGLFIVHGTSSLIEKGVFAPNVLMHSGYSPIEYTRRNPYYPSSQVALALFHKILSFFIAIELYNSIVYLSLFLNLIVVTLVYISVIKITDNSKYGLLSAFVAATSPALTRDIVWCTLFSLLGYLIVLSSTICLAIYFRSKKLTWLIALILMFLLSLFVHLLTSMVLIFSFLLSMISTFSWRLSKMKFLVLLCFLLIGGLLFLNVLASYPEAKDLNIIEKAIFIIYLGSSYFMHERYTKILHPPWNIPLIFGYLQFIFGIFGLLYVKPKEVKHFLISMLLLSIFLGSTYLIGFNYYGERYCFYGWVPINIALPLGVSSFVKYMNLSKSKRALYLLIIIIMLAMMLNSFAYQKDFYESWKPSLPSKCDLEAIEWLNKNACKGYTVLTIHYWPYVSTTWIPILTGMNVTFLYAESIANYEVYQIPTYASKGFVGFIISKLTSEKVKLSVEEFIRHTFKVGVDQPSHEVFLMFKYPESNEAKELFKNYKVKYVYLYDGLPEDKAIKNTCYFRLAWTNGAVNIYERSDQEK